MTTLVRPDNPWLGLPGAPSTAQRGEVATPS
jgi:hypothetical protein